MALVTVPAITGFQTKIDTVALRFRLTLSTATVTWARIKTVYRLVGATDWTLGVTWEPGAAEGLVYDPVTDQYVTIEGAIPIGAQSYDVSISNLSGGHYQIAVYVEYASNGTIALNDLRITNLAIDGVAEPGIFSIYGDSRIPAHLVAKQIELGGLPEENYDFRIWRTTEDLVDAASQNAIYLRGYAEVLRSNLAYPNHSLIGVRAMGTDRLYGGRPRITSIGVGEPLTVPAAGLRTETVCTSDLGLITDYLLVNGVLVTGMRKVTVPVELQEPDGKYLWLVRMDSPGFADTSHQLTKHSLRVHAWEVGSGTTDLYLQDNEEIPADTELMIFHEDADPYVSRHTAWAVTKMLINGSHGRITAASIDWTAFAEWDAWNMELKNGQPRHLYDAVIDFSGDLWGIAMKSAQTARGNLMRRGNKYSVWIDRATTHSQIFGEGNGNNIVLHPIPRADRANILTTSFLDQAIDFSQRDISRDDVLENEYPLTKSISPMVGVVRESQAIDLLDYMLRQNRYVGNTVSLDAGIDSIEVNTGGVFIAASQVKDFSLSGRIVQLLGESVQLDQPFTPEEGETYELSVWATDGTIYTWTGILEGVDLTLIPAPVGLPAADYYEHPYVLCKLGAERIKFRCIDVNRIPDTMQATLTGIEYRPEVYIND